MAGHRFTGMGFILVTPLPRALEAVAGELEGEHTMASPCSKASSHSTAVLSPNTASLSTRAAPTVPEVFPLHPGRCSPGTPDLMRHQPG